MAIKALKRPKTEFLNQSFEIKAPVTLNDDAFASLSDDERMEYEERAAIMEYDGGLSVERAVALPRLGRRRKSGRF